MATEIVLLILLVLLELVLKVRMVTVIAAVVALIVTHVYRHTKGAFLKWEVAKYFQMLGKRLDEIERWGAGLPDQEEDTTGFEMEVRRSLFERISPLRTDLERIEALLGILRELRSHDTDVDIIASVWSTMRELRRAAAAFRMCDMNLSIVRAQKLVGGVDQTVIIEDGAMRIGSLSELIEKDDTAQQLRQKVNVLVKLAAVGRQWCSFIVDNVLDN